MDPRLPVRTARIDLASSDLIRLVPASTEDARAYLQTLEDAGYKPTSAARKLSAIRQFHRFLVAENLRGAVAALASLVGEIGTEDVLGAIFARFCIGK